ncbi:MAG: RDD family protein [Culicoidibacterales bacterium]
MKEKFARFGSFMIDMSIMNMFAQVLYIYVFGNSLYITRTNFLHDISVSLFYLLLLISVCVGYQAICYRFLKNSLGKQLLGLKYYHLNGSSLSFETLLRREFMKYYLIYVTVLMYLPYSFIRMYMKDSKPPYHEKITKTHVTWIR